MTEDLAAENAALVAVLDKLVLYVTRTYGEDPKSECPTGLTLLPRTHPHTICLICNETGGRHRDCPVTEAHALLLRHGKASRALHG